MSGDATITPAEWSEIWHAAGNGVSRLGAAEPVIERIIAARIADHEAQIRDLLEALTERDAEHERGGGA